MVPLLSRFPRSFNILSRRRRFFQLATLPTDRIFGLSGCLLSVCLSDLRVLFGAKFKMRARGCGSSALESSLHGQVHEMCKNGFGVRDRHLGWIGLGLT